MLSHKAKASQILRRRKMIGTYMLYGAVLGIIISIVLVGGQIAGQLMTEVPHGETAWQVTRQTVIWSQETQDSGSEKLLVLMDEGQGLPVGYEKAVVKYIVREVW